MPKVKVDGDASFHWNRNGKTLTLHPGMNDVDESDIETFKEELENDDNAESIEILDSINEEGNKRRTTEKAKKEETKKVQESTNKAQGKKPVGRPSAKGKK